MSLWVDGDSVAAHRTTAAGMDRNGWPACRR